MKIYKPRMDEIIEKATAIVNGEHTLRHTLEAVKKLDNFITSNETGLEDKVENALLAVLIYTWGRLDGLKEGFDGECA